MEGNIYINGLIGSYGSEIGVELIDVISQVKRQPEATSFNIYINSEGGVVDVGFDIHDYIKSLDVPTKTIGVDLVASIATVILSAGDVRELKAGTRTMMHLPKGDYGESGTADEIEAFAKDVRIAEDRLLKHYSNTFAISTDTVKPLISNDIWLTEEQAFDIGLINHKSANTQIAAKAYFNNKIDKQMTQEESKSFLDKFNSGVDKILNALTGKQQVTNIMLQDANGVTLDFPDVQEGEQVGLDAKANVDGAPAEGDYVMPSGETYVFVGGVLTEIRESEQDDSEDFEAKYNALKEQMEQEATAKAALETELQEKTELVTNMAKEVKEFKASITSKFEVENKKENKKEDAVDAPKKRTLLKQG